MPLSGSGARVVASVGGAIALASVCVAIAVASLGATSFHAPGDVQRASSEPTAAPAMTLQACGDLQDRIDATPAGGRLDVSGCDFASGARVDRPITLVGGTIRLPAGTTGLKVRANDVTLDGVTVIGAQRASFVWDEIAILASGIAERPVERLTVRNGTFRSLGNAGLWLDHVAELTVVDSVVEDVVYGGIMVLSGSGGRIEGNVVRGIGVSGSEANSGNAYGIAITRGSGSLMSAPPSSDVVVRGNTVENVPTWEALDTHAGLRVVFDGNTTRGVARPMVITTDEDGHRPADIVITGNRFEAPLDGARAGSVVLLSSADRVTIAENAAFGWPADAVLEDSGGMSVDVTIRDNVMWP